jgi:hypothetical protein
MKPIYSSHVFGAARWLVGANEALQASTRSLRGTVFPMDDNIWPVFVHTRPAEFDVVATSGKSAKV